MNVIPKRLVIYTVLVGSKEPLGNPLALLPTDAKSDLELTFVCFTDNPNLTSDVWEFRSLENVPLPPEKLSRRPKALPHEYLSDWEFSLYIDNIVVFKRLPNSADLKHENAFLFKVYKHAGRTNPQQEAEAIIQLGYERVGRICEQLEFYSRFFPVTSITPLSTCTVILRQHSHPQLVSFGVIWWEQILNFGKRDQMSFDFALKWSATKLDHLPGLKHDNDLIHNTGNLHSNRILANFDPVKYAWIHRHEPEAIANPRQHYLLHGNPGGQNFSTQIEVLEYLAFHFKSSLGSTAAPRRKLTASLQAILQNHRGRQGRILFLRVIDTTPTAFTAAEFDAAELVLSSFLQGFSGTRLSVESTALASGELAFQPKDGGFDIIIALNPPGPLLIQTYALVTSALHPEHGSLCFMSSHSCDITAIANITTHLSTTLGRPIQPQIESSNHDSLDTPIPNSLVAFRW